MPIAFHSDQSLNEIQQQFSHVFPDLKIEFQFRGNEPLNFPALSGKVFSQVKLRELFPKTDSEQLQIEESMTIEQVEQLFGRHFGLNVQVYLRKGEYWLRSHLLHSLTLSPMSLQ